MSFRARDGGFARGALRHLARAVAVVTILSSVAPAPAGAQPEALEAIEELLDRQARAVREGDIETFRNTFADPASPFARSEVESLSAFLALPGRGYDLKASFDAFGDLARPSDRARYPEADDVRIYLVQERYAFDGYDARRVFGDLYLTFVLQEGEWSIASDSDLEDIGLRSQANIWDFGEPEVARSDRLLGLGAPGTDLTSLLDVAEDARRRVGDRWGRPWSERSVLLQPRDAAQIATIIQATYDVSPYVAFAFWTGGEKNYPGARIIAEPSAFASASRERALSILTHEMFHVASLESSGAYMPHFIDEGYAQWVQYAGDKGAADAYGDGELPKDEEFFTGSPDSIFATYQESLSAMSYLIERWGQKKAERLYARIGASSGPGTAAHHVDRAFRRVLGLSFKNFERAWASSI